MSYDRECQYQEDNVVDSAPRWPAIGHIPRDFGVIVRVDRLGAGHQRCFNQMPCTAAINPTYPPSRARSHTLRILLIARKLSCRRFTGSTPRRWAVHTYVIARTCTTSLLLDISDPEKWFMQISVYWSDNRDIGKFVNIIKSCESRYKAVYRYTPRHVYRSLLLHFYPHTPFLLQNLYKIMPWI